MVNLQDPAPPPPPPLATHPPPPETTVTLGPELLQGVQDFLTGAAAAAVPVSQNSSFTVDSVLNNPSHDVAAHVSEKLSLPGKAVSVSPPVPPPSSEAGPYAELSNVVVASAASPSAALSPPPSGGTTTVLQPLAISVTSVEAPVDAVNLALVQEIRPESPNATTATSKVRRNMGTFRAAFSSLVAAPRLLRLLPLPPAELDLFKCTLRWANQY